MDGNGIVVMQEGDDHELRKGPWVEEEDDRLASAVSVLGDRRWDALAKASGLKRSGKSCRLRWMNYLRPNLKHGNISVEEERIIIQLHQKWGNRWSKIARRLPGRTDNEIKNYWRSYSKKKAIAVEKAECKKSSGSECAIEFEEETGMPMCGSPYEGRLAEWMSSNYNLDHLHHLGSPEWISCSTSTSSSSSSSSIDIWEWDYSLWDGIMENDICLFPM